MTKDLRITGQIYGTNTSATTDVRFSPHIGWGGHEYPSVVISVGGVTVCVNAEDLLRVSKAAWELVRPIHTD